jgi:hypothetical protein
VTGTESAVPATVLSPSPPPIPPALGARNLFAEAERIASRVASATARRQVRGDFRAFGDWLGGEFGRPRWSAISNNDVIAAYGWHRAKPWAGVACVRRRWRPCACLAMVRALARDLGLEDVVEDVRVPGSGPTSNQPRT